MKNPTSGFAMRGMILAVGVALVFYFLFLLSDTVLTLDVSCTGYDGHRYRGFGTEEECKTFAEEREREIREMAEAGKAVGCGYSERGNCRGNYHKRYVYVEGEWVETEVSIKCAHFYSSQIADVSVECLSYFGIFPND